MKITCQSFFPNMEFESINLNDFYWKYRELIGDTKNPYQIQRVLNCLDKNTYGGWGEYRGNIWKGTYMDEKQTYIHLGIDINTHWGTYIKCPFDANVVDYFKDTDTKIGWGGRIILQQNENLPYLVLAHINPNSLLTDKLFYKKGDYIGSVGTWPDNGNTFNHLHVQCVKELKPDFDGYGHMEDLYNNPNPFEVDFL